MKKTALALSLTIFCFAAIIGIEPALSVSEVADDAWVSKTSMQQARLRLGTAAVNGKIYAIGGDDLHLSANVISADWFYGNILATNEEYDPVKGTWTHRAQMPTPRSHFGIAVYQEKIYCIGGRSSEGDSAANEAYDPKTNSWQTKAAMPTNRTRVSANTINGKIYVISEGANEVYDPLSNSWAARTPPPFRFYSTASAVVGNRIYFIGGVGSTPVTNFRIRIYDTSNDSWSYGALSPIYGGSACASTLTGVNDTTLLYFFDESSTHIYDPATDSWANGTRMQHSRGFASTAVLNDTCYVVGGIFAPFEGYIVITSSAATNEQYIPSIYSGSIDIVKPNIFVLSPQNRTHFTADIDLSFFADEPLSGARYSLDAQEPVEIEGNVTLTGLAIGYHNLTVVGTDVFGNTGSSETVFFMIAGSEPFPTTAVIASIILVTVVGVGLLVNFKKCKSKGV